MREFMQQYILLRIHQALYILVAKLIELNFQTIFAQWPNWGYGVFKVSRAQEDISVVDKAEGLDGITFAYSVKIEEFAWPARFEADEHRVPRIEGVRAVTTRGSEGGDIGKHFYDRANRSVVLKECSESMGTTLSLSSRGYCCGQWFFEEFKGVLNLICVCTAVCNPISPTTVEERGSWFVLLTKTV